MHRWNNRTWAILGFPVIGVTQTMAKLKSQLQSQFNEEETGKIWNGKDEKYFLLSQVVGKLQSQFNEEETGKIWNGKDESIFCCCLRWVPPSCRVVLEKKVLSKTQRDRLQGERTNKPSLRFHATESPSWMFTLMYTWLHYTRLPVYVWNWRPPPPPPSSLHASCWERKLEKEKRISQSLFKSLWSSLVHMVPAYAIIGSGLAGCGRTFTLACFKGNYVMFCHKLYEMYNLFQFGGILRNFAIQRFS